MWLKADVSSAFWLVTTSQTRHVGSKFDEDRNISARAAMFPSCSLSYCLESVNYAARETRRFLRQALGSAGA